MSIESHPSPTGSSSSSLFGGGETLPQPSPAKTWAQILNSNPPSNNNNTAVNSANNNNNSASATTVNSSSSTSPSSQQSATTKTISPSASGTLAGRSSAYPSNTYDQQQQQQQQQQSQMNNWSLNFNQTSSWMMNDDDSQRTSSTTNANQQSIDNTQLTGNDAFDRLDSSSPTSDWNKPVTTSNNSSANGWSNFQSNPSRSNSTNNNNNNNQWPEMNNFYGGGNTPTNSFNNGSQQSSNDNNNNNNWQDSTSSETMTLTNNNSKQKTSSIAASLTGALKSAIALSGNADLLGGNSESMISYVPQPKLVEQLGWDEPDIQVVKRANFDDGTSIWGDPMESMAVPVKKWTNGAKSALANSTNIEHQQQPPPQQQQQAVQKPVTTPTRSMLNDENWSKQSSPTLVQPTQQQQQQQAASSSSQWNDISSTNIDQPNLSQQTHHPQGSFRPNINNWNPQNQSSDDWFGEGVVDTSDWGLQGPPTKAPFDPYEGQVDTSSWGAPGSGGLPGQMMNRSRLMNEYGIDDSSHDVRMPSYDNDPYRQTADLKNPMMNMPSGHHPFPPRPGSLYSHPSGNILRPINPNGGLATPPGANLNQGSHTSQKLLTSSPVPTQTAFKTTGNNSQTPTPSQQQSTGNVNTANNGTVHAQIMDQFRLAVQAGLISQDLLNTKLPPYMLQLLQRLFEHQQKFQILNNQLNDLSKNKSHFPLPLLQNEYERLTKAIALKKQEMLTVRNEINEAHAKLKQQTSTQSQMMSNGPPTSSDQSRLSQWTTKTAIGAQRQTMFPPPPGLSQKDWQTDPNDSNENWENTQTNDNNSNPDSHTHNNQASAYADRFSTLEDVPGPPPFVPGQLWNWKSPLTDAEDDPHVTPSSFTLGPKGSASPMGNLNVGGAESAFSNPQLMHPYQRQLPPNRSQWQHDQQAFQPPMNDWNKQQQIQYRNTSKPPPPPHPSFGGAAGYRPYM